MGRVRWFWCWMGRGEGKAGGSIWKVEGGLRVGDRPGAALYHIMSLYCFSLLLRRIVSYRIALSMSPGIVVSSSVCHPHIDIHNHPHPHPHSHTLHHIRTHSLYLPFRIQIQISHITIYLWLFDFRFSIFFDSYIGPLGFRTIPHFECACSVHVPPTWLGVCVSAHLRRFPSNADIPCTILFTVFLSASLYFAPPSVSCVFSLLSLLACYVISISCP